ncbi:hypothetical protein NKH72_30155 [Mesorhizobium sp. M0955]|uniref:hypothetical protein n=1 Tax=Mesorhizobium sp. M0955 TaxID=2957033 RepID=UPI00333D5387
MAMDDSEKHVADYLASKGYESDRVVFEPDGNVTPDFLLNGHIAIEVRRLNQNYEGAGQTEGLEDAAIPFFHKLKKLVESFGPPTGTHSWFVSYDYGRPEMPWKSLKPALKTMFSDFVSNPNPGSAKHKVGNRLRIKIHPSSMKFDTYFVMGGHTDDQAGGWLVAEMIRNLGICVAEKTKKVADYRAKYPQWWLLFVDRIGYGSLDAEDIAVIREHVAGLDEWDKVIVVDTENYGRSFEIKG